MLNEGWFPENDVIHIGAEQEICLIDNHYKPAPKAMQILDNIENEKFTTELAKFNIEANLLPKEFTDKCFSDLENEILDVLRDLARVAENYHVSYVLTGILPTIRKFDLELENLTPLERYRALMEAISNLRGKIFELKINGLDELNIKYDSACLNRAIQAFRCICRYIRRNL